jgi:predicted AAA+ superfamily ATPase
VRNFAHNYPNFIELNLEDRADLHELFQHNLDPKRLLTDISLITSKLIKPGETLLFIDEIQACPRAILALRYFYEQIPDLHLIAAGSLLDFAIEEVGVPVGRVNFLRMYPLTFLEFLWALDEKLLADAIIKQSPTAAFTDSIHQKALRLFGEYIAIGGMPEAVKLWRDNRDYQQCLQFHHDLISAYRQDFEKYASRNEIKYVEHLFQKTALQLGEKFRFSKVSGDFRKRELEPALQLLHKANVINKITHTSAQGLPLDAGVQPDDFKVIMLDVALTQALLGQTAENWILNPKEQFLNKGEIAEAFVGQEILGYNNPRKDHILYYWRREKRTSQAEIDYVDLIDNNITPIEVKAGKGGTLKSLHRFLDEHESSPIGVRFSTQNYSVYEKIYSYPLYAVSACINLD